MPIELAARCTGLVRSYSTTSGRVDALKGIDADFPLGRLTAVVGPSGSGKSSLLRILAGLDRPTDGSCVVGVTNLEAASRAELRTLRRQVGFVFQRPSDNLISYLNVGEHLQLAARLRGVAQLDEQAVLGSLGLSERSAHKPDQLSGGEQQRTAFAQAIVGDPLLIVADEPTAELDSETGTALLDVVARLADEGLTIVMSTHDPLAIERADHTIKLQHGEVER